jgi:hypothetical protein
MIACDNSVPMPLDQVFLPEAQDADLVVLLADGDHVRLEWHHDEPQIDAIVSMDEAID